jgi:hypothetical protein
MCLNAQEATKNGFFEHNGLRLGLEAVNKKSLKYTFKNGRKYHNAINGTCPSGSI